MLLGLHRLHRVHVRFAHEGPAFARKRWFCCRAYLGVALSDVRRKANTLKVDDCG